MGYQALGYLAKFINSTANQPSQADVLDKKVEQEGVDMANLQKRKNAKLYGGSSLAASLVNEPYKVQDKKKKNKLGAFGDALGVVGDILA